MLRKILIGLAIFFLILLAVAIYLFRRMSSQLDREHHEATLRLQPGVIKGSDRFHKTVFYAGEHLGEVSEILHGWPADREGAAITIVGNEGAHFLDANGTLRRQIHFSKYVLCPIQVSRLDASGNYGFLTRDQSWSTNVIFFDSTGQESWTYRGPFMDGFDDSTSGDVQGDGKMEVVAGLNGSGGLVLLDAVGKMVWHRPEGNVWHVEILDTRGDGHNQILHSNASGELLVRDAKGEVVAHYLAGHYVSHFSLTRWGNEPQARHILAPTKESAPSCCKDVIFVLDASGATVARFDYPYGELMHRAVGAPANFAKDNEYFAVLQNRPAPVRSVLTLFDKNEQVAYQEIIEDSCLVLAALPSPKGDKLLMGCTNKVLEYDPLPQAVGMEMQKRPASVDKRP